VLYRRSAACNAVTIGGATMLQYTSKVLFMIYCVLAFVVTAITAGEYDGGLERWQTGILMGIAFVMMSFAISSMLEVLQDEINIYLKAKRNRQER
jgi:uncharacterized metal-binding protein